MGEDPDDSPPKMDWCTFVEITHIHDRARSLFGGGVTLVAISVFTALMVVVVPARGVVTPAPGPRGAATAMPLPPAWAVVVVVVWWWCLPGVHLLQMSI